MLYFEASAATGYNVERVFTEACQAALAARRNRGLAELPAAGDATPVAFAARRETPQPQPPAPPARFPQPAPELDFGRSTEKVVHSRNGSAVSLQQQQQSAAAPRNLTATRPQQQQAATLAANPLPVEVEIRTRNTVNQAAQDRRQPAAPAAPPPQIPLRDKRSSQLHPESAAPQSQPQRRSHLFGSSPDAAPAVSVGPGRAIPVKQGVLAKRCTGGISSEWRRKFVTLGEDGRLTYYASLHEYMENGRGRCVDLGQATVRLQDHPHHHHKRGKSGGSGSEAAGFELVTLDGRVRQFEAPNRDVRDAWVTALRAATLGRLRAGRDGDVDGNDAAALLDAARRLPGNERCADCGAPQPDWASVSLGLLICLRCSGAHRQLGTHLSRVRSLHLDSWTTGHALPLSVVGNALGNGVWEARLPPGARPSPDADSAEWEAFARAKYERGDFLPEAARPSDLADAAASGDTRRLLAALARASPADLDAVPADPSRLPPLHACAAAGSRAHLQLLLWRGASPGARDRRGRTASDCARAAGHADCEKLLRLACSS
ncbi:hypothetical protein BOX15_Mlig000726g1 [Macrostomum lignano]|nr:hypothetical protein BOX15_Mlig000726g1 [Macrostomum lignano]